MLEILIHKFKACVKYSHNIFLYNFSHNKQSFLGSTVKQTEKLTEIEQLQNSGNNAGKKKLIS